MSVGFVTRNPTPSEIELLRLALSTFGDGSGMLTNGDHTLPGWRDFERVIAAVLNGRAPEWKGVFDVVIPSNAAIDLDYGLSIKSKKLDRASAIGDLSTTGRVYMELTNSPAKFWEALGKKGINEKGVRAKKKAQEVGETLIETVEAWHHDAASEHSKSYGRKLDLSSSRFLVLSYRKKGEKVFYQWHSFGLGFAEGIKWKYRSAKSLMGFDPGYPKEVLFDFYPFSGGQLKYYPRASAALYCSPVFELEKPIKSSVLTKAARYYTQLWGEAGGEISLSTGEVIQDLGNMCLMVKEDEVRVILEGAIHSMKKLLPEG
jgi:hypothetical protein